MATKVLDRQELGLMLLDVLGCITKQLDCNGKTGQWTVIDDEGEDFRFCADTAEYARELAARAIVSYRIFQRFPPNLRIHIELQGGWCDVTIDGKSYGAPYTIHEVDLLLSHAFLDWYKENRK